MRKRNLLITALALGGPLFCLAACGGNSQPSLSSVSISVGPVKSDSATEEAKFEDFSLFYVPEVDGYLVGDYKGALTSLAIPTHATGEDGIRRQIRGLADNAFYGRKGLTTVVLRSNITYIGDNAFANTDITDLRLDGCMFTHVGAHAFEGSKVTFYEKDGISYLPSINNPYDTAYGLDNGEKIDSSCRQIIINPEITSIEHGAFAYESCGKVKNFVFPSALTSIGEAAFVNCDGVGSVRFPATLKSIGYRAFEECDSLGSAYFEISSVTDFLAIEGKFNCGGTFHLMVDNWKEIKALEIPDSVTSIEEKAFYRCSSLTELAIPSSVTSIGREAFYGCYSLTKITVDENNEYYDSRDNCNAIIKKDNNQLILGCKNTTIPSGVASIGMYAFEGCSLQEIEIPSGVTSIGWGAFSGCGSLKKVSLPESLTSIGTEAFKKCEALKEISLPPNLASIYHHAFYECKSLESIIVPESVVYMDNAVFYGCKSLTIYCRAKRTPSGWESGWNISNIPVVWGYQG